MGLQNLYANILARVTLVLQWRRVRIISVLPFFPCQYHSVSPPYSHFIHPPQKPYNLIRWQLR